MKKSRHLKFVFLLNFVNILVIISAGFMIPLWGDFVNKIGGDVQTAGTAVAIFSIIIGFFTFVAGRIVSKFDNDSWFMVVTQLIRMLAYLGYFFVTKPTDLYMVQIALGISGAFQAPALYSLYHKCLPKENTPFYWGLWTGFYNISIGVGAFVSAFIVSHLGFNAMFTGLFCVALFGLCVAIYTKYKLARIG